MPWKMKDDKFDVDSNGNPIWVDDAGKEAAIKGDTITRLQGEAKTHRVAKEAAEAKLAEFGDLDATKAREALATLDKIDKKQLIDAGKVDEVRQQVGSEYQKKLDARDKELADIRKAAENDKLTAAFASSKFARDRLALSPDLIQTMFGQRFTVKDGKVVGVDANGNAIISGKNMGEVADFDEVLETLVTSHASKDALLRGANNSGTGGGGNGGGDGAKRTLNRAEEAKLSITERTEFMAQVVEGKAQLVD